MPTKLPDDFKGAKPRVYRTGRETVSEEEMNRMVAHDVDEANRAERGMGYGVKLVVRGAALVLLGLAIIYFFG